MSEFLYPELSNKIIGLAIKVHKELGSAYAEKVYQRALYLEFQRAGLKFEREKEMAVFYGKVRVGKQVLDFVVGESIVVEVKKIEVITNVHAAQVASYLEATGLRLGLLLNFGTSKLEIKRVVR